MSVRRLTCRTGTVAVNRLTGLGTVTTTFSSGNSLIVGGAGEFTIRRVIQNGTAVLPLTKPARHLHPHWRQHLQRRDKRQQWQAVVNGTHIVAGPGVPGLYTVASGATLGGIGSTEADVLVQSGGTISPGNSPGTWASGSETRASGSNYTFEIDSVAGPAGTTSGICSTSPARWLLPRRSTSMWSAS